MASAHGHAADLDGLSDAARPGGGVGGRGWAGHGVMHRSILACPSCAHS
ncbi:hypothetical protein PXO_00799 [Xanthomonas oryzae pv. oryzae PXO99A]|uniref:Uncharacterized protein n=1 Tax=Xanthomonas oryzae pv. oryzae (strain PXO99A) TaxID=360094 RepID=A0A0K0GKZ0_XANOP|nr:hypothetical protein PXO_00799 [Xanthomonas oryzae pv. oryzae PXO99A]